MSLGWRSAGLCLAAAFPPRAAAGSRFHLLPLDSSCCPEVLLSGAAPSSSVGKGCSGNYLGLQERHQSLGPVCQGELSMWLNFFADQKHPCRFGTLAAAAFFCPVPIWTFFVSSGKMSTEIAGGVAFGKAGGCYLPNGSRTGSPGGRGAESFARCVVSQILP